jgi:hypothetical protein
MQKVIKKFLSCKKVRNRTALAGLIISLIDTGIPWSGQA